MAANRLTRITVDPNKMGGVPIIRDLRIPVATIVAAIAEGETPQKIMKEFPDLEPEDIKQALIFASKAVRERQVPIPA